MTLFNVNVRLNLLTLNVNFIKLTNYIINLEYFNFKTQ